MSASMMRVFLVVCVIGALSAAPIELHTHPEVAIIGYTGPLSKGVMQLLRGVEILDIIDSNITAMEAHFASELPNLRILRFKNLVVDVDKVDIEDMLTGAHNLREFHASHITAKRLHPEVIRRLQVEVFELDDNTFPTVRGNMFNETNLRKLKMRRDNIEKIEDGAFNGLDKLEILDLDTNKIKELPKELLVPLKSIKSIKLKENLLEKFGVENLPELPHLETLDIAHNPIKELNLDNIEKVAPKLTEIKIAGSQIPEAHLKALEEKHKTIKFVTD